jgi:hypothetical protein
VDYKVDIVLGTDSSKVLDIGFGLDNKDRFRREGKVGGRGRGRGRGGRNGRRNRAGVGCDPVHCG